MDALVDRFSTHDSGALFSPCRRWRYLLFRRWDSDLGVCMFIGLNPSTADELKDDPTIRRCLRFAKDWGFGALWMTNLFAYRATDPEVLKAVTVGAVGLLNDEYLRQCHQAADLTVLAWGAHGTHQGRDKRVIGLLRGIRRHNAKPSGLSCLGVTASGQPRHPLRLSADTQPQPWPVRRNGAVG